jgi:hypothetical protein
MTRRLAASLVATLLVYSVAVAPDPLAKAALPPIPVRTGSANPISFDVRVGDGIFRVRIRSGEACDTSLTIEIRIPGLIETSFTPARPW